MFTFIYTLLTIFVFSVIGLSLYFKFGLISKREIIGYALEIKKKFPETSIYCDIFIEKIVSDDKN